MLRGDVYTWTKALHVAAAIISVAGVLVNAVLLAAFRTEDDGGLRAIARRARDWDCRVTTPAMIATWTLGPSLV